MTPVAAQPAPSAPSRTARVRYAVGSLGTGGFGTLPGLVLVFYLTDTLGVSALAAGVVVTLAKVWDVIVDPAVGSLSDREQAHRGGRRRPMIAGALALPLCFALTFAVPAGTPPLWAAVWVGVGFVLSTTAFSLFQVPYIALPAELADGYDARTRLLSARVVVLTAAILLFGAGGPALRSLGRDEASGYLLMAVVAGLVIGLGMLVASGVAPRTAPRAAVVRPALLDGYRTGLAALKASQPFRALLAAFVLQGLATGLMLAAAQYVATWVLRSTDAVTLLFIALIAPALVATPLWSRWARRIGKERAYLVASILFGVAALLITAQLIAPGGWIYGPVALAGAAYAGMQALPMAMLPDVIALDARERGSGRAGIFGGVWTAGETLGMALGATVLSVILAGTGYLSSTGDAAVEQPESAIVGIVLSFSLVPAALLAASLAPLTRYRIRRSDVDLPESVTA